MPRYVALFRAVNVAGHARIAVADLVRIFAASGARDVASFGHAGNIMFSAPSAPGAIVARARETIGRRHGERPVIVERLVPAPAFLYSLREAYPDLRIHASTARSRTTTSSRTRHGWTSWRS